MSWSPLVPPRPPRIAPLPQCCTASSSAGAGRLKPRLFLVLRPGLFGEGARDWLSLGRMVDVAVGYGEHAGRLRIVPGDAYQLGRLARGRPHGAPVVLRLPMPASIAAATRVVAACEATLAGSVVEVMLPAWGRPAPVPRGTQLAAEAAAEARRRAGL